MSDTPHPNSQAAEHEKKLVALSSVAAAVFLTSMKIVVGLLTGSLGILSEAAHSGLDLVAAAVTFFAVRISGKPADQVHTYGHGKVENLSALFETVLLLLTCVWIIYEAIQRLFFKSVEVQTSIWSFGVMAVSILVDITRSRALSRVAKKYESQALEADALHFSTDIWSSSVVIVGLILVALADTLNLPWLAQADAVAAIGVAIIVVYVSVQLGKKTISDLLDAIPPGLRENVITAAAQTPGVKAVKQARIRRAGPEVFADLTLEVERDTVLENAQKISDRVEERVLQVIPRADVIVLIEPSLRSHEGYLANIRSLANQHGLSAHGIRVYDVQGEHSVEMHVEVKDDLLLSEAHQRVASFEEALKDALPDISNVVTHIEPAGETSISREAVNTSEEQVREIIARILDEKHLECTPQDIVVRTVRGEMNISMACQMDPDLPITEAHTMTEILEQQIRERIPGIGRIMVHLEPGNPPLV